MPKVAIVVTEGDVEVAKRVYEQLEPTGRRFVDWRTAWDRNDVPGTRTLPLRQLRALFDAARGRGAGPFARFYTSTVDDNWMRFQASNRTSEINVLRPGARNPSITHSGSGQQTNIFGLGGARGTSDGELFSVEHSASTATTAAVVASEHKYDAACPCADCSANAGRPVDASDFGPEQCKCINRYGFYPVVVDNWSDKRVIHDCLTHAPPEVRRAHGLDPDAAADPRPRSPSDTRRRTNGPAPAASSAPSHPV